MDHIKFNSFKLHELFLNKDALRVFLQDLNLIIKEKQCPECSSEMKLSTHRYFYGEFRCQKKHKTKRKTNYHISALRNSFFENAKISIESILHLIYCFVHKCTHRFTIIETKNIEADICMSTRTTVDWYQFCREVCTATVYQYYQQEGKIGGDGHRIEIDQMQFGKRKYPRKGKVSEGSWILGMIDVDTQQCRLEICSENGKDGDSYVLKEIINKHVEKGTEIWTDSYDEYSFLKEEGFIHHTVNHKEEFATCSEGENIKTGKFGWNSIRTRLSRGGIPKENLGDHLCEYLWHLEQDKFKRDPFLEMLSNIAVLYKPH